MVRTLRQWCYSTFSFSLIWLVIRLVTPRNRSSMGAQYFIKTVNCTLKSDVSSLKRMRPLQQLRMQKDFILIPDCRYCSQMWYVLWLSITMVSHYDNSNWPCEILLLGLRVWVMSNVTTKD